MEPQSRCRTDCQTSTQCPGTEASADPLPNPHAGKAPTLKVGCEANLIFGQSLTCLYLCFAFVLIRQQSLKVEKAMAPHSSTLAWKIPWTEDLAVRILGFHLDGQGLTPSVGRKNFLGFPGGASGKESACNAGVAAAKSLQSCPTLCDPIDGSPPGAPVPGPCRPWRGKLGPGHTLR